MQMLHAAGYPIYWNKTPNCDAQNPKGYFEWEELRKSWVSHGEINDSIWRKADHKIVKVFPHLFPALSPNFDYQIIYIDRELDEVVASQQKMLRDIGRGKEVIQRERLERLRHHAYIYLNSFPHTIIPHESLYDGEGAREIHRFLGEVPGVTIAAMNSCVDFSLRHHGTRQLAQVT